MKRQDIECREKREWDIRKNNYYYIYVDNRGWRKKVRGGKRVRWDKRI